MMKVFISQPMKGKTNEEIKSERNRVINKLKNKYPEESIEVIESFFENAPHDSKPLWFLGESLKLLSTADIAVFVRGWDKARGCVIEHECCKVYNIKILRE